MPFSALESWLLIVAASGWTLALTIIGLTFLC